jgi:hypothetical protein
MGPGFETNLLIVLAILGVFGALLWALRKELRRLVRYFKVWSERDQREEELAKQEREQRVQAEAEVREYFNEQVSETEVQVNRQKQG